MTDRPFGFETLTIPAYFAKGDGADDPGLARWKAEHPDWFEAGTWTPAPRPRPVPPALDRERPRLSQDAVAASAAPRPLLDPATLSIADFRRVADAGRTPPSSARALTLSPPAT